MVDRPRVDRGRIASATLSPADEYLASSPIRWPDSRSRCDGNWGERWQSEEPFNRRLERVLLSKHVSKHHHAPWSAASGDHQ